ncbi:DNA topoisomerase 3-alpha-like [Selaginella moellendorffii]|uniref:DNA topoisomerase 3-alpha-like n=1 Tax=Selaginella moellendorffii TaxID=88036 RepID=UPI000D1CB544|nr:DNA topoisomerase 3-alpha-like [Selaginella moellendorffii]|eukprot:XP_024517845.1 DNA topoisomerase 3-alpha-like [Selaginella moellendorffii]
MAEDGDYTAALRGSNSDQWQALKPPAPAAPRFGGNPGAGGSSSSSDGACYRCGQAGHWSRDCSMRPAGNASGIQPPPAMNLSSKSCPCGAGMCVLRTSNTAKNPGRQFLTCPAPQGAKCSFFEWCDAAGAPSTNQPPQAQQPGEPELKCRNCNQPCVVFTARTDKNSGRRFYKCKNEDCHFFKWCDEAFAPSSSPGYKPPAGYGGANYTGAGYGGASPGHVNPGVYGGHGNVSSGYGGPGFGGPNNTEGGYGGHGYGGSGPTYSGGYGARGNASSGYGRPGDGHPSASYGRGYGDYGNT